MATAVARAGIDPTLDNQALREDLLRTIAAHGSSCTWTKLHTGWVVNLEFPEERAFFGTTLEEALAWCLVWLLAAPSTRSEPPDRVR